MNYKMKFLGSKNLAALLLGLLLALTLAGTALAGDYDEDRPDFNMYRSSSIIKPGQPSEISVTFNNTTNYNAFYAYAILTIGDDSVKLFGDSGANYISQDIGSLQRNGTTTVKFNFIPSMDVKSGVHEATVTLYYKNRQGTVGDKEFPLKITVDYGTPVDLAVPESSVTEGQVTYGQPFQLNVKLANQGETAARDVQVSLNNLTSDTFFQSGSYDSPSFKVIQGHAVEELSFYLMASKDIKSGYLPIELKTTYTENGEAKEKLLTVYVNVEGSPDSSDDESKISVPRVILSDYRLSPSTVNMGENFQFSFTVQNTSTDRTVKNLQVSLTSSEGTVMPAAGSNSFYIPEIAPGESKTLSLQMTTKYDTEKTTYPLALNFSYEDSKANPYTSTENLTIPVFLPTKFTLQNQSYPESGMVGEGTYLSLEYINKGKGTIYNLTASIEGNVQTDVGSSSYIGNVDSGYADSLEIMITPLEAGVQNCKLVFTFEDAAGNQQRVEEPFVMNVEEMPAMDDPGMMDPGFEDPGMYEEEGGLPGWLIPAGVVVLVIAAATAFVIFRKKQKAKKLAAEEALFADQNDNL